MNTSGRKGPAARKAVTERLRRFFAERTAQLAAGTAEIWSRVERQIAKKSPQSEDAAPSPPKQQQHEKAAKDNRVGHHNMTGMSA